MTINLVDNASWRGDIEQELGRLERLVADLRRMLAEDYPSSDDLAGAVTLINSVPETVPVLAMRGFAAAHPELGNRPVVTSPIIVEGAGWVRTWNRLYVTARSEAYGDPV